MINCNEIIIDNTSKDFCRLIINKKVIKIGKLLDVVSSVSTLTTMLLENNILYDIKFIEKEDKK